jgi:uncharacterized protein with HEPN domain
MDAADLEFVRDMPRYAETAIRLLGAANATELPGDERTYLAVRHAVEVVGGAANNVSKQAQAELAEIPWSRVIGMRHRLVHGCRHVRAEILEKTIREELPRRIALLKQALRE